MKKIRSGNAKYQASDFLQKVLIDPVDAPQDMDHNKRSKSELMSWWQHPYVISKDVEFEVRVLDAGAWDRTRSLGLFSNVESAVDCARLYQPLLSEYYELEDLDLLLSPIDEQLGEEEILARPEADIESTPVLQEKALTHLKELSRIVEVKLRAIAALEDPGANNKAKELETTLRLALFKTGFV